MAKEPAEFLGGGAGNQTGAVNRTGTGALRKEIITLPELLAVSEPARPFSFAPMTCHVRCKLSPETILMIVIAM